MNENTQGQVDAVVALIQMGDLPPITPFKIPQQEAKAYLLRLGVSESVVNEAVHEKFGPEPPMVSEKVPLILNKMGGIECVAKNCLYSRSCSQHYTAGEFRSDDGFTPMLSINDIVVGETTGQCKSFHIEVDESSFDYDMTPVGHSSSGNLVIRNGKLEVYHWDDERRI